jgi:adenine phosphoribosyltransferase
MAECEMSARRAACGCPCRVDGAVARSTVLPPLPVHLPTCSLAPSSPDSLPSHSLAFPLHLMNPPELAAFLKVRVRTVRDWPKPRVNFRDVTTLFGDPDAFRAIIKAFAIECGRLQVNRVAAVDARGFILGGAVAYETHTPFVLVRKKGKLPFKTVAAEYVLEYGTATIEIHADACQAGDRVLIVDDLIATGGTLLAAVRLLRSLGAEIVAVAAVIDLPELGGSARLREQGLAVHTLCEFSEDE